jgi:1-acyl-sn-glycerol-3-phosphate acyltransferase
MWFFLEFLPQIISLFKKILDNIDNTKIILILATYILVIILITLYFSSFIAYLLYAITTLIFSIVINIILNTKKINDSENVYFIFYELEEYFLTKKVKYKQLTDNVILIPSHASNFKVVFSLNAVFLHMGEEKIYSDPLNIKFFLKKIIFRRMIYDSKTNKKYVVIIKINGYIFPEIEIKIKRIE